MLLATFGVAAQAAAAQPPIVRATAAILIDARTGEVLYAKNPDLRLPPASTTKIVTALLLARSAAPTRSIPVSPAAAAISGNALGVRPGETFTARDLLYA